MSARVGSLCTGYGGLDHAALAVFGGELAWVSDPDPGAAALLAHRYPDVPNLGDLTAVDWADVEPVEVLTAGWPCQPWSQAGRRKGIEDDRAIWPEIAAAVRAVRPRFVVLENVSAIAAAGELARACGDLAEAGYVGSWRCLRASDVGAPHRRERVFIAAQDTYGAAGGQWGVAASGQAESGRSRADAGRRGGASPAHSDEQGPQGPVSQTEPHLGQRRVEPRPVPEQPAAERGATPADIDWAGYGPAIERWERVLGRSAPAPVVLTRKGGKQLSAAFVEWMMGLPDGWVCDVPGLTRSQRLKLLGNGVVPLQAEAAIRHLLPLLNEPEVAA